MAVRGTAPVVRRVVPAGRAAGAAEVEIDAVAGACAALAAGHWGGAAESWAAKLRALVDGPPGEGLLVVAELPGAVAEASGSGGTPPDGPGRAGPGGGGPDAGGGGGPRIVGYGKAHLFTPPPGAPPRTAPVGHYLGGVCVAPYARRLGVGRALVRARLDRLAERTRTVRYFANARNTASIALHAAFGFRVETRDFAYPGVTFDGGAGVLFRVDLLEPGRSPA